MAVPSEAIAGPGHRPASPQPIPNSAAPLTSRPVMSEVAGRWYSRSANGFAVRARTNQAAAMTSIAPPMTKASVGSQSPNKSRKPRTRAGFIMPDSARPKPKIAPDSKAINARITMLAPKR